MCAYTQVYYWGPLFHFETSSTIEPPKSREMLDKPDKKRGKSKEWAKKYKKLSRKGENMVYSICKKTDHNKDVCAKVSNNSYSHS